MLWGTSVPLVAELGFPSRDKGRVASPTWSMQSHRRQRSESYPQIVRPFPLLWTTLWITSGQSLTGGLRNSYFHWVETPKPAAMKPKPATMFQLPKLLIGRSPSVT